MCTVQRPGKHPNALYCSVSIRHIWVFKPILQLDRRHVAGKNAILLFSSY